MNGDFNREVSGQVCGISVESSRVKETVSDESFPNNDANSTAHHLSKSNERINAVYGYPNSHSTFASQSNGHRDSMGDVQSCNSDNGLSRSNFKDTVNNSLCQSTTQNKLQCSMDVLSSFGNDQMLCTALADSMGISTSSDGLPDSLNSLSLKSDNIALLSHHNNSGSTKLPLNGQFIESHCYNFEQKVSTNKHGSCNFSAELTHNNPINQTTCHSSLTDTSSSVDNNLTFLNSRSQVTIEGDVTHCLGNVLETQCTPLNLNSNMYWNSGGNATNDEYNIQSALSNNNLSPLLSNLLYQQTSSNLNSGNSQLPNTSMVAAAAAAAAAKRAITGCHQIPRSCVTSRSPGWNATSSLPYEPNALNTNVEPLNITSKTSSMVSSSKPSNWMSSLTAQNRNPYPWQAPGTSQQSMAKASFGEVSSSGFLCPGSNNARLGLASLNSPNNSGINSNGFSKSQNSYDLATIYNMFPKRPQHRMMAHWQQQQQHQNMLHTHHLQQNISGQVLNKPPNTEYSGVSTQFGNPNIILSSTNDPSIGNQKINHASFTAIGQNPTNANAISNNILMGNNLENVGSNVLNPGNIGSDKLSSVDSYKFGFDQQLIESMKSFDPSSIIDEISVNNQPNSDNYHNPMINQLTNLPQSSCRSSTLSGGLSTAMSSSYAFPPGNSQREDGFSRKVFVGGLPPDIDEEEITTAFRRFGQLIVDWPHKTESKAYFPPKGYCFLLFQEEQSVQNLINACIVDESKYYWCVSSPTMKDKPVQIRPWNLADSDFVMDGSQLLDPRKTIFVGGVPRPLRAIELALIMDRLYGGVCYAGIDIDPELKYPKGAGRVAFSNQQSYIAAISARFVQLQHNDIDKRVEVKPYVLDNQMCDECQGARCGGKFAPFFCANVTCLQYYCEQCWVQIHSRHGREYHKPLVKEGAERPRPALYRW